MFQLKRATNYATPPCHVQIHGEIKIEGERDGQTDRQTDIYVRFFIINHFTFVNYIINKIDNKCTKAVKCLQQQVPLLHPFSALTQRYYTSKYTDTQRHTSRHTDRQTDKLTAV